MENDSKFVDRPFKDALKDSAEKLVKKKSTKGGCQQKCLKRYAVNNCKLIEQCYSQFF